jgi:Tfp pilus assembly protein PilN
VKLGNFTPSGVQIEMLKLQQSALNIKGRAMTYTLLAQFINKLEHAQVLGKVRLEETKADAEKNITFSLLGEF